MNLSLMDRTKRQVKAAREQQRVLELPVDDDVQDLEEVVLQTRERVKAAKAAKQRAAALHRELQELQDEEQSIIADQDGNQVPPSLSAPMPVSSDPGAFVAASLNSAVIYISLYIYFYIYFIHI